MLLLPVSLTTAAAVALLNLWLAMRIGQIRRGEKISVGDGGSKQLLARMRAHANLAEYAPIVLILFVLVELAKGANLYLWGAALVFVFGRILHVFGMDGWMVGRVGGIVSTIVVMLGLAVYAAVLGYQLV